MRRAEEQGLKVAIGIGQTESSPYFTHTLPDDPNPTGVNGRPAMPQTEIKIVSTAASSETVREIRVKSVLEDTPS